MPEEGTSDDGFDWIQIKNRIETDYGSTKAETFTEKLKRKCSENPFVPFGSLLTAGALTFGLISFRKGDSATSQIMMRFRIAAQGFTVVALLIGIGLTANRNQGNKT